MARINIPTLSSELALHEAFTNTSKAQVESVLRHLLTTIADHVVSGDEIALAGFGTFKPFTSSTSGKKKPKFTAAKAFKDAINA